MEKLMNDSNASGSRITEYQDGYSPAPETVPQGTEDPPPIVHHIDPHHLVAITAHVVKPATSSTVNRRNEQTADLTLWNDLDGSFGDGATNEHTFPILEAFASICIWKPNSQVVAVALQKDNNLRRICITISGNNGVDTKVVSHLEEVLKTLKELSDLYAEERNKRPDYRKWKGWTKDSPNVPAEVGDNQKQMLVCRVYTFIRLKNKKRVNKWWGPLRSFTSKLQGSRSAGGLTENMKKFLIGVNMLHKAIMVLQRTTQSGEDWKSIVEYMDTATTCLQPILDDSMLCELWASDCREGSEKPFFLRRALEKLTSPYRHMRTLIAFANSPRLRYAFEYAITVRAVPPLTRTVSLPASVFDWRFVVNNVCDGNEIENLDNFLENQSLELANRYPQTQECYIHCECSLIVFLETEHHDSWDGIPTLSFIGVSKLCCGSCYNWVKGFNALGGRKYTTKGTHSKYYWPWAMPTLNDPVLDTRLEGTFVELVRSEYVKFQVLSGRFRIPIDSTDASSCGAGAEVPWRINDNIGLLGRKLSGGSSWKDL